MSITLTPQQADAAAEVLEKARSEGTAFLSEPARQVLSALIHRYALAANSARRVSQILLPPLPGDDELDGAPVFATVGDAQDYYLHNQDGIYEFLVEANIQKVDEHISRVVRGWEHILTTLHEVGRRIELADLALASAQRQQDKLAEAHALMNRGGAYKMGDQPRKAISDYRHATYLFAVHGSPASQLVALSRLAVAYISARELDEADVTLNQVLAMCGDGDDVLTGLVFCNRAWAANERGEWAKAIQYALIGLDKFRECAADQAWMMEAHFGLVRAYTETGDIDNAQHHLDALKLVIESGFENVPPHINIKLADGELLLAQRRHLDALDVFRHAVALQSASAHPFRMADALDGMGRALSGLGKLDGAIEQHSAALAVRVRTGERFAIARSRCYLATVAANNGRMDMATEQRGKALLGLEGLVDPAADALRTQLTQLSL